MKHISKLPLPFLALSALIAVAVWGGLRGDKWHRESDNLVENLFTSSSSIVAKSTDDSSFESLPSPVRSFFQRTLPSLEQNKHIPSIRSLRFKQHGHFRTSEDSEWAPFSAKQTVSASDSSPGFVWEAEMALIQKLGWPRIYIRDAWVGDTAQMIATVEGIVPIASEDTKNPALLPGEIMRWLGEAFVIPTALLPGSGNVAWSQVESEADTNKVQLSMSYLDHETVYNSKTSTLERVMHTVTLNVTFVELQNDLEVIVEGTRQRHKDGAFEIAPWIGKLSRWKSIPTKDMLDVIRVPTHMEGGWKNPDNESSIFFYFIADNHDYQYDWDDAEASSSTTL
jgi:hypothetical protein